MRTQGKTRMGRNGTATILFVTDDQSRVGALTSCLGDTYRVLVACTPDEVARVVAKRSADFVLVGSSLVDVITPLFADHEFGDVKILVLEPKWPAAERKRAEGQGVLIQVQDTTDYTWITRLVRVMTPPRKAVGPVH